MNGLADLFDSAGWLISTATTTKDLAGGDSHETATPGETRTECGSLLPSLGGEVGEEVVELLPLVVLDALELLDARLVLFDLGLLLVELLQVALVRRRRRRHLLEVGPQPRLVVGDGLELPLQLADLAARTGRSVEGARQKREELGIPNPASRKWTAEELALLATAGDAEVARQTGRTAWAVYLKRKALRVSARKAARRHAP